MDIKIYKIEGEFKQNGKTHKFATDIRALSPKTAFQRLWANFGSKHGLKMREIKIKGINEIKPEESTNLVVSQLSKVKQ